MNIRLKQGDKGKNKGLKPYGKRISKKTRRIWQNPEDHG